MISAGVRDANAEGVEGMSASKMRKAVADDYEAFKQGTPSGSSKKVMTRSLLMQFVQVWV